MPTVSEGRVMISLRLPVQLVDLIEEECRFADMPTARLVRKIIKWHAGNGPSRHPEAPVAKLPKRMSKDRSTKTALIDQEDAKYLDKLAMRSGFSRVAVLLLLIHDWLDLDPIPRKR